MDVLDEGSVVEVGHHPLETVVVEGLLLLGCLRTGTVGSEVVVVAVDSWAVVVVGTAGCCLARNQGLFRYHSAQHLLLPLLLLKFLSLSPFL